MTGTPLALYFVVSQSVQELRRFSQGGKQSEDLAEEAQKLRV